MIEFPVFRDDSAIVHDGAQCVIKAFAVMSALVNFDIGEQTKERAAPICTSPCMGVIEALVAFFGEPLMHIAHHLAPYVLLAPIAGARARDGLNVHGTTFFDPVVLARDRRKS